MNTDAMKAAARLGMVVPGMRITGWLWDRKRKKVFACKNGSVCGFDEHGRVEVRWDDGMRVWSPRKDFWDMITLEGGEPPRWK
jgi:hypothetical protein